MGGLISEVLNVEYKIMLSTFDAERKRNTVIVTLLIVLSLWEHL